VAASIITLGMCLLLYQAAVMVQNKLMMNILYHRTSDRFYNAIDWYKNNTTFTHGRSNNSITAWSLGETAGNNNRGTTNKHFRGVILVTKYGEQQVGAAMNMFSLQKWAKIVNASVVEPFVNNSVFGLPFVNSQAELSKQLRFRDYFNVSTWNKMSVQDNGTPLISWEHFLDHKPKKCIILNIVNDLIKEVVKPVHIDDEIMQEPYCKEAFLLFKTMYKFFIDKLHGTS